MTPFRALVACGIRPSGEGTGPRGQRRRTAATTGRLPPGILVSGLASGQRSTDSTSAGDQKAPRTSVTTGHRAHEALAPEPAPCSGRPPPFLRQWPNTGPTCQQSQRDSLPGREEERTPKGCERARNRDSPIWGAPDPRLHIYSPTLAGRPTGAQAFDGPESGARGPTLYGVVRALVDFTI